MARACHGGRFGRANGLVVVALAGLPSAPQAEPAWPCRAATAEAALLGQRSRWRERSDQGRQLVREQGTMPLLAAAFTARCGTVEATLAIDHAKGSRRYDGLSSNGAPLQTHSGIRHDGIALVAGQGLAPGWSWGLRLARQRMARDIADAGPVRGYPERFSLWQLAIGARHTLALGGKQQFAVEGWVGGGGGTLDLQLPFADATRLKLGHGPLWRLDLRLGPRDGANAAPGWQLHWVTSLAQQRLSAGPAQALMRGELLVGGAAQPHSTLSQWQVGATLRHAF